MAADISFDHFNSKWVEENLGVTGYGTGRGSVTMFRIGELPAVLRHYQRGGLIGRFNKDKFIGLDPKTSRPFQEFSLLRLMQSEGLPVPQPVAAQLQRHGLLYSADLITKEISNAKTFLEHLQSGAKSTDDWVRLGRLIARFHNFGIDHTDLNVRNVLVDQAGELWLIDFDKCAQRPKGGWMDSNLARLKRSIEKEFAKDQSFLWQTSDWDVLRTSYEENLTR